LLRLQFALFPVRAAMLRRFQYIFLAGIIVSVTLLTLSGCNSVPPGKNWFSGKKKDKESPLDTYETETKAGKPKLVKDCASIGNYNVIPVRGFGLVVNLPGTGGEDANSIPYRWVYDDMNRRNVSDIRAKLARPDTAVVAILGQMSPGIQKGDRFDVQISLIPNSETKSLRGGILMPTWLTEEVASVGGDIQTGTKRADVAGPILVDDTMATETNNPGGLLRGTILSGAVARESRSLSLHMKDDSRFIFVADRVAKAINQRFSMPTGARKGVADAKTDALIVVDIHPSYANDVPRYVRVIQSIACFETAAQQLSRIERLKEEILQPAASQEAAFQLEAIGKPGIEALQQALRSPNMEVQFHAATSLAYLEESGGTSAKVLAAIAQMEPAFRIYALNALSVMKNDLEAEARLQELLHVPSRETRYGAFRALKNRNPMDQTIRGELLGGQFSYHGITSRTDPMVHITMQKYPEVVLFGSDIFLRQPFALEAGAVLYVNGQTPGSVVVTRFVPSGVDEKRTVSNRLDEIIRAVVDMGGTYPDVVQMLRQAEREKVLSCRLEIDCLPEANRVYRRSGDSEELDVVETEQPKSFLDRLKPKNIFSAQ